MGSLTSHYGNGNSAIVLSLNRVEKAAVEFQKRHPSDKAARQAEFCFSAVKTLADSASNNGKAAMLQCISSKLFQLSKFLVFDVEILASGNLYQKQSEQQYINTTDLHVARKGGVQ